MHLNLSLTFLRRFTRAVARESANESVLLRSITFLTLKTCIKVSLRRSSQTIVPITTASRVYALFSDPFSVHQNDVDMTYNETIIKRDLYLNGPLVFCFVMFEEFQHYTHGALPFFLC